MTGQWVPLLEGEERARAMQLVSAIAVAVRDSSHADRPGLLGKAGSALFLAYAGGAGLELEGNIVGMLEQGLSELSSGTIDLGLWAGAAGFRWLVGHLAEGQGADDVLERLDGAIGERLIGSPITEYDLHCGLAGVLLAYADDIERGPEIVAKTLDHLERIALPLPQGNRAGCAHGLAGILCALACCYRHGHRDSRVIRMMLSVLNTLVDLDVSSERVAWCRGAPGLAVALVSAARALERRDLEARAVAVALAPFSERGTRWPEVSGLCHGSAGLSHLLNRLYQATGDGRLGEYARRWLVATIDAEWPDSKSGDGDLSLLTGRAGVGLVLLAGATSCVPSWDRILGADIPTR